MKSEIRKFLHRVFIKYGMEGRYFPEDDIYSIRFKGRAIQNFNSNQFYHIPKRYRFKMLGKILKLGLEHNVGERSLQGQMLLDRKMGKKI